MITVTKHARDNNGYNMSSTVEFNGRFEIEHAIDWLISDESETERRTLGLRILGLEVR
jgi:hypothetical protein